MKTADLERSKRLKELGWEQNGYWAWIRKLPKEQVDWKDHSLLDSHDEYFVSANVKQWSWAVWQCSAPQAGEMIEWLLGEVILIVIDEELVTIDMGENVKSFEIKDGLCNALADACAWVKERKK